MLVDSLTRTGDADFTQFYSISHLIDDRVDDLVAALKSVDPTFKPMFHGNSPNLVAGFISASGFKVEFLTPNRGNQAYEASIAPMPALGPGVGAQVLRFLDFLIKDPIRTVVLHEAGIPVSVPQPSRYAVHKLIVSTMRSSGMEAKVAKDLSQVVDLLEAFALTKREADVGFAWIEAWGRGASWRRRLMRAALRLSDQHLTILTEAVNAAALLEGLDPEKYGMSGGRESILKRLTSNNQPTKLKAS